MFQNVVEQRHRVIAAETFEDRILYREHKDAQRQRSYADQIAGFGAGGSCHRCRMLGLLLIRYPWRGMFDLIAASAYSAAAINLGKPATMPDLTTAGSCALREKTSRTMGMKKSSFSLA